MNRAVSRVEEIRSNRPPFALACSSYSCKALSVLGYVGQSILLYSASSLLGSGWPTKS